METPTVADLESEAAAPFAVESTRGSYRDVLAIPAFRRLWVAQAFSVLGDEFGRIALPLLAYGVTGSAVLSSQVFIASMIPRIVLAPFAGLVADRVDRRLVMMASDVGRGVLVCLLPFTTAPWQIAALATLVAVGNTLSRPAELAAVPQVVPSAHLITALSATQVSSSTIRIVGPAAGAAVIGVAGPRPAFFLQGLAFLISFIVLLGLRLPRVATASEHPDGTPRSVLGDIKEGILASLRLPMVRGTAMVEMLWQLVTAVLSIALVVYVATTLGYGDRAGPVYALLMAMMAAGATAGALVASRVERRLGRGRMMAVGYLAPLLLITAAFTPPTPLLFLFWFLLGFGDAWAVIAIQAYLAEAVGDEMRGRVYAIWGALVTLGAAIGFFVIGRLTAAIGPPATIGLTGLVVGIGGPLLIVVSGAAAEIRRRGRATLA